MDTPKDEKQAQAELLLQRLDTAGLSEYVRLSQKTGRILWLNFLSGIARGLGFSIGATWCWLLSTRFWRASSA